MDISANMNEWNEYSGKVPALLRVSLHCIIDDKLDKDRHDLKDKQALWDNYKDILAPIVLKLQDIESTSFYYETYLSITNAGDKATLAKFIRTFRTAGFKSNSPKPVEGATSWSGFFSHPVCKVDIYFTFTSTVCKKVPVKTEQKLVDVPVYEIQCGNEMSELGQLLDDGNSPVSIEVEVQAFKPNETLS